MCAVMRLILHTCFMWAACHQPEVRVIPNAINTVSLEYGMAMPCTSTLLTVYSLNVLSSTQFEEEKEHKKNWTNDKWHNMYMYLQSSGLINLHYELSGNAFNQLFDVD